MSTTVCVIGNFSGRNAGDAAILDGVLSDISRRYADVEFLVPTIRPGFVRRQYARFNVRPVALLPWNGSLKIFGIPIIYSLWRSDVILVTDAILFDHRLFNPLFNYLSTMALVLPLARVLGRKVVLYNVNLGPVYTRAGRWCLNRVLRCANEIIVRDSVSLRELQTQQDNDRVFVGADSALNASVADGARVGEILRRAGIDPDDDRFITVTPNSYINAFRSASDEAISENSFLDALAEAINRFLAMHPVRLLLVVTQVMDTALTAKLRRRIADPSRVSMISTRHYSFAEIAGVFGRAEMHVGARTHSLILASAQSTPVIALLVTPKNRGYMEAIDQLDRSIDMTGFGPALFAAMCSTWDHRHEIRAALEPIIGRERRKAAAAAERLRAYFEKTDASGHEPTHKCSA